MTSFIVCGHCDTPAVAELDGDFLCAGCLMNIVMCLEEAPSIRPLHQDVPIDVPDSVDLTHVYQEIS